MIRVLINILKFLGILAFIVAIFYTVFKFLIINNIAIKKDEVTTYQFYDLTIVYVSSCVTTLALIVALLKDEIRYFFISAKIVIKPKSSQFLIEKYDSTLTANIKADSYEIILTVMNNGSLQVNSCSVSLIDLVYAPLSGHSSIVDISTATNIIWTGKNLSNLLLHSYGGKAEVSILQIKSNDASTADAGQSQPVKLFIGGIDTAIEHQAVKGSKWIATYMISYDTYRPIKYKLAITWDGEWHDRLTEMLKNCVEIKEEKK